MHLHDARPTPSGLQLGVPLLLSSVKLLPLAAQTFQKRKRGPLITTRGARPAVWSVSRHFHQRFVRPFQRPYFPGTSSKMAPAVLEKPMSDQLSEAPMQNTECADRLTLLRSMPEAAIECQVCVVGAGPAGLMLGCNLGRFGVNVEVVDDRADQTPVGRQVVQCARTRAIVVV